MKNETERVREWSEVHQPFELDYHKRSRYRWDDEAFFPSWRKNFGGFLGLGPAHFADDEMLLDVGSGSRTALSYFTRGEIHCIEPLGVEYLKIPEVAPFWTPELRARLKTCPAEIPIPEFRGAFAFVNCWNVLDHSYDYRSIVANIISYAKAGGIIAICTDTKTRGVGHPGIDRPGDLFMMIARACEIERLELNYTSDVRRDVALKARKL